MITRMGILKRRPDLTPEQFRKHWLEVHGPLAARLPGLRRYHQNHVVDTSQLAIDHARGAWEVDGDRKSTRLNSSHANISYAVFCLKKKKKTTSKQYY